MVLLFQQWPPEGSKGSKGRSTYYYPTRTGEKVKVLPLLPVLPWLLGLESTPPPGVGCRRSMWVAHQHPAACRLSPRGLWPVGSLRGAIFRARGVVGFRWGRPASESRTTSGAYS